MAKPPPDADPEKFVIGRGTYDNLETAVPFCDDHVVRIDPRSIPVVSTIVYSIVFAAFFIGIHLIAKHFPHGEANPWLVYAAPLGVGLLTSILFTAVVGYSFAKERRLGPWMIYEKATGRVALPREGASFERHEIVHLQYITTKRLDWDGVINNDALSELNLITCRDGDRKRWPLLHSMLNVYAFDRLLQPILEHTDLPVVRVKDQWLGGNITEHLTVGQRKTDKQMHRSRQSSRFEVE